MNLNAATLQSSNHRFYVTLAKNIAEVRQAQALRYHVFAEEMGAKLHSYLPNHDVDHFDAYCHHLLVREKQTHQVIGCTRILTNERIQMAGGFYSESEFDLSPILNNLPGRFIEVGRTCVHPHYRNGNIISLLWSGLAHFMVENNFNYLMGCVSIPMPNNHYHNLFTELQNKHGISPHLRVLPRNPLLRQGNQQDTTVTLPPLFKAYLRLGVQVCGDPCWDPDFQVADVFILVNQNNLQQRYMKHFVARAQHIQQQVIHEVAA